MSGGSVFSQAAFEFADGGFTLTDDSAVMAQTVEMNPYTPPSVRINKVTLKIDPAAKLFAVQEEEWVERLQETLDPTGADTARDKLTIEIDTSAIPSALTGRRVTRAKIDTSAVPSAPRTRRFTRANLRCAA